MSTPPPLEFPPWPPDWPEIAAAIEEVVRSGDWGRYRGQSSSELVRRLTHLTGRKHCRLVSSGSIGVEVALRGLGVTAGDRVALCCYDYPGNFRAVELVGARPVLVDVAIDNYSIAPDQLTQQPQESLRAVIVSHLYGVPASIASLRQLCDRNGWKLIEDACQTPGMAIEGEPAGSWGDVGVLSFGGSKPLTAGNGGALVTNDDAVASKLSALLDRPSDSVPMGELQAATLPVQLDRLAECNAIRHETVSYLLNGVGWLADSVGKRSPAASSTLYKLALSVNHPGHLISDLADAGIPAGPGYRSMHRSSNRRCDKIGTLAESQALAERLCLIDHRVLLAQGEARERFATWLSKYPFNERQQP